MYPFQNLLEGVGLPVGRERHVGVAVGHARHREVRDKRVPWGVGDVAGNVQVMGPIEVCGASTSNLGGGLNGVVEGVHHLDE